MEKIVIMFTVVYVASVVCGILSRIKREKDWEDLMTAMDAMFMAETFDELVEKVDAAYRIAERHHDRAFNTVRDGLINDDVNIANLKHLWKEGCY